MNSGNRKINNKQKGQPLKMAMSNDTPNSKVDVLMSPLIINLFFDGTRNNMYNSKLGREDKAYVNKDDSYKNYYSNVALLYMAFKETATAKRIYIEGSGSAKGEKDHSRGLIASTGKTGVNKRIINAFEKVEKILKKAGANQIIFNLFGFSRGSFFARYFCHLVTTAPKQNGLSLSKGQVSINFMGLYDTVSSAGLGHYNDVKEFKLNIGKAHGIRKIVHLTAQNEYRNHFPLTRVNTAANHGIAFECSLPGAHSDIGGGYSETTTEQQYLSRFNVKDNMTPQCDGEIDWQWFKQKGYYAGEPKIDPSTHLINHLTHFGQFTIYSNSSGGRTTHHVYANRTLNFHYQFIPLEIMRDIAIKQAMFSYLDGNKMDEEIRLMKSKPVLLKFRNYAYQEIMKNHAKASLSFEIKATAVLTPAECKTFYNQYIHNSLDPQEIANGSSSDNKGPKRIIINDDV